MLLTLFMVLTLVPMTAFAANTYTLTIVNGVKAGGGGETVVVCFIPVVDLPVTVSHVVFAGENRCIVQDADTPIIIGYKELLSDDQICVAKHFGKSGAKFRCIVNFKYAKRK